MTTRKKQEYAHVLAGRQGNMARFQLVFEDGRPVDEAQVPVSELDSQRSTICDGFLETMKDHGITAPEQYKFINRTLRGFRRGEGNGGYETLNVRGIGKTQMFKYESYFKTGILEESSKA